MRVSLNWLREFVAIDVELDALTATLDDLGLVVEGSTTWAKVSARWSRRASMRSTPLKAQTGFDE
jgi:hypothetical protein